jgi:hypothetical protein
MFFIPEGVSVRVGVSVKFPYVEIKRGEKRSELK